MSINNLHIKQRAFTIVELMVGIAIVSILAVIALPSLNQFTVGLRVDNQVSELHKMLLIARNTAINTGQEVVICPLESNVCTDDWAQEISVFIDANADGDLGVDAGGNITEEVVRVKSSVNNSNDQLKYSGGTSLTYNPSGNLTNNNSGTFRYCPSGFTDLSRGIVIAISGRAYKSRNGDVITCTD